MGVAQLDKNDVVMTPKKGRLRVSLIAFLKRSDYELIIVSFISRAVTRNPFF